MATKLYLLETTNSGIGSFRDMGQPPGLNTENNSVTTTTAGGTQIQLTQAAGGAVLEWISQEIASGWTMSGVINFLFAARESGTSTNAGLRARLWRRNSIGVETEIGTGYDFGSPTELSTSLIDRTWTGTPPSTLFYAGDRIVVRLYAINVGTMGASTSGVTAIYGAPTSGTGAAYVEFAEDVPFVDTTTIIPAVAVEVWRSADPNVKVHSISVEIWRNAILTPPSSGGGSGGVIFFYDDT